MPTSTDSFVHLHVHSEYSMLDGAARVAPMVEEAVKQGMPAVAVTDHGNMFGAFDFYKTATAAGLKPIIGTEAYITPGTHRSDKTRVKWGDGGRDDVSGAGSYTHMTLLSETTEGMHNLFRLSSKASLEGYYFKPRMDRELLSEYSSGLIATTGCPSGEVQTRLRLGQYDEALKAASDFRDIFGRENYFAEIMDHGLGIEKRIMGDLLKLAKQLDLPLVATNDLHYTHEHDATSHAALLCVQSGSTLSDPNRFKFDADEFYLKTAAQMRHLFRDHPEACDNTLLIAERCEVKFDTEANYMPRYPVPEGETEDTWFVKEVEKGLDYRYPDGIPQEVRERADYEVGVIAQMGFPGYFLVVADFINWSKDNGIRVGPGRGSGAGSMAAYAMRITDLDPLRHGLIFERFLNPDRVSMPDFDVDFDDRRRTEVINYVTDKYGSERVAQIVTYGTIKAKQALKDSSRVLGFPFGMGEKLTKAMPPAIMGKDIPLTGIFDREHSRYKEAGDIRAVVEGDPEAKTVFDTALGLEGLKRQWGVHAAGVIMSSDPLIDIIPIMKREQDGQIVTQFDYPASEALGLIKMDFLGLRNLTIINDALDNIKIEPRLRPRARRPRARRQGRVRPARPPATRWACSSSTAGPCAALLRLMKPDNFEDISAVIALYRPGPMGANSHTNYALRKNGLQEITPIHPELEEPLREVLGGTYGLIIYQEQVMSVAQKLAGFSLGQADILRRAMGKKKKSELDKQFAGFQQGMLDNGYSADAVQKIWDILLPFSDYAFNKAHSAAYGVVSLLDRVPQGALPGRVHGGAADERRRLPRQARPLPQRVPPHGHQGARRPTSTSRSASSRPSAKTSASAWAPIRNVGFNVVDHIIAARERRGRVHVASTTSCARCRSRSPTSARSSRWSRRARSTRWATPAEPSSRSTRAPSRRRSSEKRAEANGQVGFDFDSLWDEPAQVQQVPPTARVVEARQARLRARHARSLRLRPPARRARAGARQARVDDASRAITAADDSIDGETVTVAGLHHQRAAPRRAQLGQPVRHHHGRRLLRRDLGHVPRQDLPGVRARARRRLGRRAEGASRRARRRQEPPRGEHLHAGSRRGREQRLRSC